MVATNQAKPKCSFLGTWRIKIMQEEMIDTFYVRQSKKFMMRGNYLCTARRRIKETCCRETFSEFNFTTDHMNSITRKD